METPNVGDQLHTRDKRARRTGGLTDAARLRDVLAGLYTGGHDSNRYDQALESLRRDPEEMMVAIIAAYGHCPAADYPQRQALVGAASAMKNDRALPFLASVALSEIPPEAAPDAHNFSTVAEETIIRMTAVDGIAHHASRGLRHAVDLLMQCVGSTSFSVRRAAVTGLMATPDGQRLRPEIEARIPKDQHFIFDLRKIHVSDAIQVKDPTRHLVQHYEEFEHRKPHIQRGSRTSDQPKTK